MCDLLDAAENRGIEKGLQKGLQRGLQKGLQEGMKNGIRQGMKALISTCRELGVSFEETAAKLKEKYGLEDVEVQENMRLYWQ